ncbi:MAG TPA: PglZ domain-containing protein, partial [Thermoanaerobaculia bacterium]|nr:PglZ domain-containing protein [Thermoanaerobaculia bacterium]
MTHPLHDYVARQVADRLKARRIVVWYDPRREFEAFMAEARGGPGPVSGTSSLSLFGQAATLAEFDGSFLAVRVAVEPLVSVDAPGPLLVYVPGVEKDRKGSLLMELEAAGEAYE